MKEGHSAAGRSIIEMITEQLDVKYARLMELIDAEENWGAERIAEELLHGAEGEEEAEDAAKQIIESAELRGALNGLCYSLAKLRNPYKPDVKAEKSAAQARWEDAEEE